MKKKNPLPVLSWLRLIYEGSTIEEVQLERMIEGCISLIQLTLRILDEHWTKIHYKSYYWRDLVSEDDKNISSKKLDVCCYILAFNVDFPQPKLSMKWKQL